MLDPASGGATPRILSGRYRLEEPLGRGAGSVVHRARDTLLGRSVAVKLFTSTALSAQDLRDRHGEARLLGSLNHPGLVTLLDAGVDAAAGGAAQVYLVLELVNGPDLRQRLEQGALSALEVGYLGWDILAGLDHIHQAGVLHRDVKPANVLLTESRHRPPRAKLTDFGIALLRADQVAPKESTTGTAAYLSPEQLEGRLLTPASDVYSFGLVVIEAFTGRICFPGDPRASALARLERSPAVPAGLPPELARMTAAMTARDPADRPSAGEAMAVFRGFVAQRLGAETEREPDPEAARLAAVRGSGLLDSAPDEAFDRVTTLAARLFDVPIALVTVVDEHRIWLKSHHGVEVSEVERRRGLAMTGGLHDTTLVIEDLETDPRTADPALARADGIRFFAGVPLVTPEGHNIGSLAILDRVPHRMSEEARATLEDLAAMVLHEMELRRATRRVLLGRD